MLLPGAVTAQDHPEVAPPKRGGDAPNLTYQIEPLRPTIPLGGKMRFRTRLRNEGPEAVLVFRGGGRHEAPYRITLIRPDGKELPTLGTFGMPAFPMPPAAALTESNFRALVPGGELEYDVGLGNMAHGRVYFFREPGEYTIKASFLALVFSQDGQHPDGTPAFREQWRGELSAPPVSVQVEPAPSAEASDAFGRLAVQGLVVDSAGTPVGGAQVFAGRSRAPSAAEFVGAGWSQFAFKTVAGVTTDDDGCFRIERLPDDSSAFEIEANHPDHALARRLVINRPPQTEYEVRLVLGPAVVATGMVVDPEGRPVPGARVTCSTHLERETWTDADGRFRLPGAVPSDDGTVRCGVWKQGWDRTYQTAPTAAAQSGEWRITVVPDSRLSFGGQARFADGQPVAAMNLSFPFLNAQKERISLGEIKTDAAGRYRAVLRQGTEVSGYVLAVEPGNASDEAHGCWLAPVEGVRPGRTDVDLVFERNGMIEAVVQPANQLPPGYSFRVSCLLLETPRATEMIVAQATVGADGGSCVFRNLSGGRYRIRVTDAKTGHTEETQEITLPLADGGKDGRVEFRLPPKHFGALRARVLDPDGKTPLPEGRAFYRFSEASGWVQFLAGRVEFPEVPVGRVMLRIEAAGYAAQEVKGQVRTGQTTDLGDIVLATAAAVTGWVEGRVLYDDGTPALGAELVVEGVLRGKAVAADGGFRHQVPAGEAQLAFDLRGLPRWPRSGFRPDNPAPERAGGYARFAEDILHIALQVPAGTTVRKDITIPISDLGNVEVKWHGDPAGETPYWKVFVERDSAVFAFRTYPMRAHAGLPQAPQELKELDVPTGLRTVMLRTKDYCGWREGKAGSKDDVFEFDPAEAGVLAGTVTGLGDAPTQEASVELQHPSLAAVGMVRGLRSTMGVGPDGIVGYSKIAADGTFQFPHVAPGQYLVRVAASAAWEASAAQPVTIRRDETTTVSLTVGESHQ
jgi:protocatechuate 3,4-dioxygenase beta subunit